MAKQRIELLGVPVDICRPEDIESEIMRILEKQGTKQIVFLTIWDLLKARKKRSNLGACIKNADLILPISKSILSGAKFLKLDVPVRYNPFNATIHVLSILDKLYKSVYLLGGRKKALLQAERNVRETFRGLQIVGRFVGYFSKDVESDVVQAIRKASPSLVIVGDGIKEKNLWSYNRRDSFSSSIFLYYKDCLGIFSDRIRRVSAKTFDKGMEIWSEILHNPLEIFLIFPYCYYLLLLLGTRLFGNRSKAVITPSSELENDNQDKSETEASKENT